MNDTGDDPLGPGHDMRVAATMKNAAIAAMIAEWMTRPTSATSGPPAVAPSPGSAVAMPFGILTGVRPAVSA